MKILILASLAIFLYGCNAENKARQELHQVIEDLKTENTEMCIETLGQCIETLKEKIENCEVFKQRTNTGGKLTIISQETESGIGGGTCVAGSMLTRTLNKIESEWGFAKLKQNQIELDPGTYSIMLFANAYDVGDQYVQFFDVKNNLALASSLKTNSTGISARPNLSLGFTIKKKIKYELRHSCQYTRVSSGLGRASGIKGIKEEHAKIYILKLDE